MATFKFTNPGFNSDHQKVIDFQEEDTLEISGLPGLRSNPTFLLGEKKSDFEGLKRSGADLIYILEDGRLFYNPNGPANGFGPADESGLLFHFIRNKPRLTANNLPGFAAHDGGLNASEEFVVDSFPTRLPQFQSGDTVSIQPSLLPGLSEQPTFYSRNQYNYRKDSRTSADLIYDKKRGRLNFNANGVEAGFGEGGGLLAQFKDKTDVTAENIIGFEKYEPVISTTIDWYPNSIYKSILNLNRLDYTGFNLDRSWLEGSKLKKNYFRESIA